MLVVVFTHDRPEMLKNTIREVGGDLILCNDEDWSGKRNFWKKWKFAVEFCKDSDEEYFLFVPDDFKNYDLDMIKRLTMQGWDNHLFAVNLSNDGRSHCWGGFGTGQPSFNVGEYKFDEVGFVDCGFLTNKHTIERLTIDEVPEGWFNRPDKSSGVGHQLTKKFRSFGVKMITPTPSLAFHGDHESKMHGEHRKDIPLISK